MRGGHFSGSPFCEFSCGLSLDIQGKSGKQCSVLQCTANLGKVCICGGGSVSVSCIFYFGGEIFIS